MSCPEYGNFSEMINDTRYDYYSLYANPARKYIYFRSEGECDVRENYKSVAPTNATCVPTVGVFVYFYDRLLNYTQAGGMCEQAGGTLAHILSEIRTNSLSSIIYQNNLNQTLSRPAILQIPRDDSNSTSTGRRSLVLRHAYVGLSETKEHGRFYTSLMEPIHCFRYRAWAPGFPR